MYVQTILLLIVWEKSEMYKYEEKLSMMYIFCVYIWLHDLFSCKVIHGLVIFYKHIYYLDFFFTFFSSDN